MVTLCYQLCASLKLNGYALDLLSTKDNGSHLGKSRESSTVVTFHTFAVYCAGKKKSRPAAIFDLTFYRRLKTFSQTY